MNLPEGYKPYDAFVHGFEANSRGNFVLSRELYAKHSDISDKKFYLIDPHNGIKEITPELGNVTIESYAITNTPTSTVVSGMYFLNDVVALAKKPSRLFYFEL